MKHHTNDTYHRYIPPELKNRTIRRGTNVF
ncbi:uncharacterized protein METZ01_LOCUS99114 [marine metagenome]|uniref:Uncharacterized protein n=1 Tax=marine metagenome TaxID=408172 RepID=A0A381W160_9ZZZZ